MQGQTAGTGLSDRGRAQVQAAATGVRQAAPAGVVSSDLLRCRQTAAVLAAAAGLPVRHDPRLRERSFGRLEGLLWDPARERLAGLVDGRVVDPQQRPVEGESLLDLQDRVRAALERAVDLAGGPVVVVTHGGPVRVTRARPLPGSDWGSVPHAQPLPVCLRPARHRPVGATAQWDSGPAAPTGTAPPPAPERQHRA